MTTSLLRNEEGRAIVIAAKLPPTVCTRRRGPPCFSTDLPLIAHGQLGSTPQQTASGALEEGTEKSLGLSVSDFPSAPSLHGGLLIPSLFDKTKYRRSVTFANHLVSARLQKKRKYTQKIQPYYRIQIVPRQQVKGNAQWLTTPERAIVGQRERSKGRDRSSHGYGYLLASTAACIRESSFVPMLLITFHIRLSTGRSLREFPEIQQNGVLLFLGSKHFTSRRKKLDKNEKDMSHRTIVPC
ncbi:hypothetical protein AFLA_003918 [Aspergillus flavus NRRL3357]|nr:hypothetical protein AFLA_003918 [Aspergillus flavus NRRL3357]